MKRVWFDVAHLFKEFVNAFWLIAEPTQLTNYNQLIDWLTDWLIN